MASDDTSRASNLHYEVARTLKRWADWSSRGRSRRVLSEAPRHLQAVSGHPELEAPMLLWVAQAQMDVGQVEAAVESAQTSWELDPSAHATHTLAIALNLAGELPRAIQLLELGLQMHPPAFNLSLQLAMFLGEEGRVPEALDLLRDLDPDTCSEGSSAVLYYRIRAGMSAAAGCWREADEVLRSGIDRCDDPDLESARGELHAAWSRTCRSRELAAEWTDSLDELPGRLAEVDDALEDLAAAMESSDLVAAAARRLWRSLAHADPPRVRNPRTWAAACLTAVFDLDGRPSPAPVLARISGCHRSGISRARRRVQTHLEHYDTRFRLRSFAAHANPRLDEEPREAVAMDSGSVVPFPRR